MNVRLVELIVIQMLNVLILSAKKAFLDCTDVSAILVTTALVKHALMTMNVLLGLIRVILPRAFVSMLRCQIDSFVNVKLGI